MQQNKKALVQGSQYWIQKTINSEMKISLESLIGEGNIKWLSPLEDEEYKEYQLNWKPVKPRAFY